MADYSVIYGKCFTQAAFKVTRIHTGPGSNTMDSLHSYTVSPEWKTSAYHSRFCLLFSIWLFWHEPLFIGPRLTIDNRATKRDWKRAKNWRANAGKTPMTSHQILVSGVSVRRRGPLTGIWSFISCAGHPLKGSCAFTNIQRYLQHSGRKLYHAQLWIAFYAM